MVLSPENLGIGDWVLGIGYLENFFPVPSPQSPITTKKPETFEEFRARSDSLA
ncbi:hypothetical protein [Nostoc sp.]|uniref:hypothetical protein n=1 Tax=Nostoc sp. TaxID=1180 RepID=UPI002FF585A6